MFNWQKSFVLEFRAFIHLLNLSQNSYSSQVKQEKSYLGIKIERGLQTNVLQQNPAAIRIAN